MIPRHVHQTWFVALAVLGLLACATPPKPPELEAFEKLRGEPASVAAAKRAPDLINSADQWLSRAREEWSDNDLEESAHSATMGHIKLKQALAIAEMERAKARIASADSALEKANDEYARLQKDLDAVRETVTLLKRLHEKSSESRKLAEQLSEEKKTLNEQLAAERAKAGAGEKIADAELALKNADTVNAKKHAAVMYGSAVDMLTRAQQEFQQGSYQAAQTSADLAKKKADEAADAAKPQHSQEAENAESRARAEALARDAASLPRIVVRREAKGSLQRLVLPIPAEELFTVSKKETTIASGKGAVLDDIAGIIKKYPSYPVQVIGYSDSRGRTGELLALSLARAQSVYSALVLRGVDARRMVVSGQGAADPISDNRTSSGRARNNRVEIVFLYQ